MSTCHQAHNIPWNSFLELLHKVPPKYVDLFLPPSEEVFELVFTPDEEGRVAKKLRFFANKVESAIKEFSSTERSKFRNEDIDNLAPLFDKSICNKWLAEDLQELSAWSSLKDGKCVAHYCYEQYLEALKELFIQEQSEALLHLARKGIEIERLQFVTYSNFFHYGLGRIKEDCLTLYIHLNLLLATGTLCDPDKWYVQWRRFHNQEILKWYDGNSQRRMYAEYFEQNPKFEDLDGLQNLLKKLFRMLYLYDMIMAERGIKISWEEEVLQCVSSYFMDRSKRFNYSLWCEQLYHKK